MDLNLLSLFTSVAETSSFSEASRRLRLPRSSVSRQIAVLERDLGVRLFNRTTRHVALSTAGKAVYERIAPRLADLRRSLGELPERDELPSGDLRLAAPNDLGVALLPEVLAGFDLRYPGIHVDVHLSSRFEDLVTSGFDVALRAAAGRLQDSSLVARRLSAIEMDLFASPIYLARRPAIRTPEDTASHDWVSFRGRPPPPPFPKPTRRARVSGDDMLFVHQLVRVGLGIGLLPAIVVKADVAAGHLVRLLPRHAVRTATLYFVHPRARNVPKKVTALRDYLIEYIASHPLASGAG